ncbi:MAG: cytosolic protein [Planctomycetota bacterium]|nr:MAG: cytosolic protein [Planctomycetota bacterium]
MECKKDRNKSLCNCSYEPCARKGICCDCLQYHLRSRQLPACCFPADAEATYDRSFEHFARLVGEGKV